MLNRFVSVCKDLFNVFGWYVVSAVAVIVLVGLYAAASHNVALLVVVGLALVVLFRLAWNGEEAPSREEREAKLLEDARKAADQAALKRARDLLMREPIMKTVHAPIDGTEL